MQHARAGQRTCAKNWGGLKGPILTVLQCERFCDARSWRVYAWNEMEVGQCSKSPTRIVSVKEHCPMSAPVARNRLRRQRTLIFSQAVAIADQKNW